MEKNEIKTFIRNRKNGIGEKTFKRIFSDDYCSILNMRFPSEFTFKQKLYHYLNDDISLSLGICPECENRCGFININKGYHTYCSNKCSSKSKDVQEKIKNTNVERYGVDNVAKSEIVKNKMIKTNIKRYGVDNVAKSEMIKNKTINTNMNKYGVKHVFQNSNVKEKIKKTNIEKYGCENVFSSISIKDKIKESNLKKYGTEYIGSSEEIKEKIKNTNLEKYGVQCVFSLKETREKIKKTNIEKFGAKYPMQNESVKNKLKQTCLEKYGVQYVFSLKETHEKIRKTNLEKYGVEWYCMTSDCRSKSSNDSKPNRDFAKMLDENDITYEREFHLENYSYDFKIGNVLVEINPTITHNTHLNIFGGAPKDKNYHLSKTLCAKQNGYNCIHIWDWDDQDKIVNMLKQKQTLYARNLEIREVPIKDANLFLNANHLQDTCNGQTIIYGLYIDDRLHLTK